MKLRKITAIAGAAAVLGLGLGACGSSAGRIAPVSHAPVNYKAQYLADVTLGMLFRTRFPAMTAGCHGR